MSSRCASWWVVVLPGEEPEAYGPYKARTKAQAAADERNQDAPADDLAYVIPVQPPKELKRN